MHRRNANVVFAVILWRHQLAETMRCNNLFHGFFRSALAGLLVCCAVASVLADRGAKHVHVAPIEGMIDLGLAPYLQRVLDEAQADGAAAVILDINTFGGRVDAAVVIRDALLGAKVRTIAFVNKRAISAGALISLAAETLVMAEGATIGAATPVQAGQPGEAAKPVDEKTVSYVRKEFRATAEYRKRPPEIAEAMVDPDVAIAGVIGKGKLLTLTTDEAMRAKVADFRADNLEAVLLQVGLAGAELRVARPNWAENLVRFLTHPVISSLLITVGILGIVVELRTPGFGIPGALGIVSLGLFFWGHSLVQLAGWEEILLVTVGVVLLAVEIFVIPGFGVVGGLGIAMMLGGLVLSLVGAQDSIDTVFEAALRVSLSLVLAIIASLVLMRFLPHTRMGRRLVLDTGLSAGEGYASAPESDSQWLGRIGVASTPLHPAGIAEIEGSRVDVVSMGEPVDAGETIEVVRVDGNRIVVRRSNQAVNRG
jgi:membrane-bound serine protease (ClpP class)